MANNTNNDSASEKSAKNRLAVLNAIAELEEKIAKKKEAGVDYDVELNKQLEKSQRNLVKIDKFLNGNNQKIKDGIDLYKESADSISSMSSMMGGLKNELQKSTEFGIEFSKSIANTAGRNKGAFEDSNQLLAEMTSLTSDLAQLNKEDAVEIASKANEIDSLYKKLNDNIAGLEKKGGRMTQNDQELLRVLKERFDVTKGLIVEASKFANISKDTKEIYEELGGDLEFLNKTFKKIAITASIFFSSFKNALGVSLFYVGGLVDEFNDLAKGVGGTVGQMFQLKTQSFLVSKVLGDEAGVAVTSLAEKLGNANDVTLGMSMNVGVMSGRLGVSGEEAAQLVNQFGNLSGLSSDVALDTMEATSQLASANGVAPANVMKDIAQNTEFFATYAKDGGANIGKAAIEARRLGVDLGTAAKISDNLLDYQTSVQSEMQASVLLGRNLNLNKARELAYAGDAAGAMKEALNAAGGISAFNNMDVYQRRAVAEAIGVSVGELQQMVANQEHAATSVGKLEAKFDSVNAAVREMGAGIAGTAVKGVGGMLIGMKDVKTQISDAKEGFDFIKDSAKGIGSLLTGKGSGALTEALSSKTEQAIKGKGLDKSVSPKTPGGKTSASQQKEMANGFKEMGKPGVGSGILNTALAGPALLLFSIGTPGMMAISAFGSKAGMGLDGLASGLKKFGKVPITAVGIFAATGLAFAVMTLGAIGLAAVAGLGVAAGAGLTALGGGLQALGKAGSAAIEGIGILALFGIALIPLTYALSLLSPLVESIGKSIGIVIESIATGISTVVGSITAMMVSILPLLNMDAAAALFAIAGGFIALSASLVTFSAASLLAVPGMLAVGAFTALGGDKLLTGGGEGGAGGETGGLLEEIKGLREDIKAQPIIVQLDGRQVYLSNLRQQKNKSN